uniref:Uncharacterized protein n=1 Tax=Arundo donax TaxID=35708 RepID=A0A0A8XXD5_ARUDO
MRIEDWFWHRRIWCGDLGLRRMGTAPFWRTSKALAHCDVDVIAAGSLRAFQAIS